MPIANSTLTDIMSIVLEFSDTTNLDHFLSINADHRWWLSLYNCRRIDETQVSISSQFVELMENKDNYEKLFSRSYQGKDRIEYLLFEPPPTIVSRNPHSRSSDGSNR